MSWYTFLKFLHVVLAITAVGFNASYAIWLARAAKEPQHEEFALRGVKFLDDRIANPAYGLLLVTGVSMVLVGDLSFKTLWIALALTLFAIVTLIAALVYTPTLKRQIEVLQTEGAGSATYQALAKKGNAVGILLAVLVLTIVFLMVTKPT
ncbi:MAG: hypothetical protein QOH26_2223 [Actinomycetota bacterium]|jgi:uncharacterized membrane protein|nr:hypothetical protein [Actinomycetota bacterium]